MYSDTGDDYKWHITSVMLQSYKRMQRRFAGSNPFNSGFVAGEGGFQILASENFFIPKLSFKSTKFGAENVPFWGN